MRWHNHKLVTFSVVYAATGGLVPSLCAMSGSVLPDVLEIGGLIKHRTVTHWPYPYLAALIIMFAMNSLINSVFTYMMFFVVLGAVMHLLEDVLSIGGLPFGKTPTSNYYGLGIYRTHSWSEEGTMLGFVVAFMLLAWARGFWSGGHFADQIHFTSEFIKSGIGGLNAVSSKQ